MTTATTTLTDFLLARLSEDEAAARAASPGGWQYGDVASVAGGSLYDETRMIGAVHYEQPVDHDGSIVRHLLIAEADANGAHIARHDPARVLAECAAKRAIVDAYDHAAAQDMKGDAARAGMYAALGEVLIDLAAIYADHPEYRSEWAP